MQPGDRGGPRSGPAAETPAANLFAGGVLAAKGRRVLG